MGGRDCDSAELEPGPMAGSAGVRARSLPARLVHTPLVGAVVLAVAVLLFLAPRATAAGATLHTFEREVKGEGKCGLVEPGSVAVNEHTGEIWVTDRAKSQLDRLSPSGECLSALKPFSPEYVAIDQNTGDVYVAAALEKESEERVVVRKYGPEGKFLRQIKKFKKPEKEEEEFSERGEILGLGVDAGGGLWVYQGEAIQHFTNEEPNKWASIVEDFGACSAAPGFTVSPNAEFFYVGRERENSAEECEPTNVMMKLNSAGEAVLAEPGEPETKAQLDNEATSGVAVDSADQVYFDNVTSVASFDTVGQFVQRFGNETGPGKLVNGSGAAVDSAHGTVYITNGATEAVKIYKTSNTTEPTKPTSMDGREWEQVTPHNKLGATIFPINFAKGMEAASEDGSAVTFVSNTPPVPAPPTNRAPEPTQDLSKRGSSWTTDTISPPAGPVPSGYISESGDEYELFSSDLSSALVNPQEHELVERNEPLLSPEATEGTPYVRDLTRSSAECEPVPSGCYVALVWAGNDNTNPFVPFGGRLVHFASATPDLKHSVLRSEVPLTAEAAEKGQQSGLYEAETRGGLQLVSVLPQGEAGDPSAEGGDLRLGGPGENNGGVMRNAISTDGSRVIWSTERGAGKLYLRDTVKHETIRLDKVPASEAGEVTQPEEGAQFQTASTDGSRIFFTDKQPLMKSSTTKAEVEENEGLGDLYVCEIGEGGGCTLKDLTTEVRATSESAAVQGVPGASDNGTTVYYVADGVLSSSAGRGTCEPRGRGELHNRTCNLYVQHLSGGVWQPPRFVASLSIDDQNDWQPEKEAGALTSVTSRVSPNGEYLAFMSNRSLTGYNNVDASEAAKGARDEEVFLYSLSADAVQCASCNPDGSRPHGVLDTVESGEGAGLVIDRPLNWQGHWLAANIPGWTGRSREAAVYQSRYLSDTGRLFFNSVTSLVPADTNTKADVYEFEHNGEGTCSSATGCIGLISSGTSQQETAFIDASVSGNDVFFLSSEKLGASDKDTSFDIYDAHVCSPNSPCIPQSPEEAKNCTDEGSCKGAPSSVPASPPAPPSSHPGTGNAGTRQVLGSTTTKPAGKKTETRKQKLAKALKACKKLKKKSKRKACERQAQRKYGSVKKSTHHSGSKKGKK